MIKCSRKDCSEINNLIKASIVSGISYYYCRKHYTLQHMAEHANRHYGNKLGIIGIDVVEELLNNMFHGGKMLCGRCKCVMGWFSGERNSKNKITLQHNRDGTLSFWCLACNSGESKCKNKHLYSQVTTYTKICYVCNKIKNKTEFHKNKSRPDGLCNNCKECRPLLRLKYER